MFCISCFLVALCTFFLKGKKHQKTSENARWSTTPSKKKTLGLILFLDPLISAPRFVPKAFAALVIFCFRSLRQLTASSLFTYICI